MQHVAIIGLGGIGRYHLSCYRKLPDIQVVAVADIRADEIKKDESLRELFVTPWKQVRWYDTCNDLLAREDVDFVDIGLPTDVHKEAAITYLNAGVPVLCEKPMALSLADCDAMIAASQQNRAALMIAQCIRFWPEYQYLKDMKTSGAAGRLLSLQMWRGGSTPGWNSSHWMMDPARSGGAILDLHIHDIDFCQYLLGLPKRVYAQGGCAKGAARGYDYVLTNLDYGDDTQVSAASHWADLPMPFIARYEARFERAFIRMDPTQSHTLAVYRSDSNDPEYPEMPGLDAYASEIAYFGACVRTKQAPERCMPLEARNSVAIIMAAKASIESSAPVPMNHYAL
ncbi:MAG: Gfo/Idh/MocA family oxidoreductase [Chloroflexi bacterium]|nr:Gfo/Idh/MocA family oxidoreductase [Chloroflexota bacterium]